MDFRLWTTPTNSQLSYPESNEHEFASFEGRVDFDSPKSVHESIAYDSLGRSQPLEIAIEVEGNVRWASAGAWQEFPSESHYVSCSK